MTGVTMAEILGDVDGPPVETEVKTYPLPSQASGTADRMAVHFFDALYAVGVASEALRGVADWLRRKLG